MRLNTTKPPKTERPTTKAPARHFLLDLEITEHFGDFALFLPQSKENPKGKYIRKEDLPNEVFIKIGKLPYVSAEPVKRLSTWSEQGHEYSAHYTDFRLTLESEWGKIRVSLSDYLAGRKFTHLKMKIVS